MTQSNQILTAIVHGMKRDEVSNRVRLAATNACLNSLEFTKSNFDNEVILGTLFISLRIVILTNGIINCVNYCSKSVTI